MSSNKPLRPKSQSGCIAKQIPSSVIDANTGEVLNVDEVLRDYVLPFLYFTLTHSQATLTRDWEHLLHLMGTKKKKSPTGFAWEHGIHPLFGEWDKKNIQALSRVERIIQHRVITEAYACYEHPTRDKKTAPHLKKAKANLGACDQQLASIGIFDEKKQILPLRWKCWTREFVFFFQLPAFCQNYDIIKYSLPTVYYDTRFKEVVFDFPFEERLNFERNEYNHCYGGHDLGQVEVYTLTLKDHKGRTIAVYHPSRELQLLNDKRERCFKNLQAIKKKLKVYDELGIPTKSLKYRKLLRERFRLTSAIARKATAISKLTGFEIAEHCARWHAAACAGEDLSRNNEIYEYGSSHWNHGEQQEWIERECRRRGIVYLRVNAQNTSQTCDSCGHVGVKHNSTTRMMRCPSCNHVADRDVNASGIIASRCYVKYMKYMSKVPLPNARMRL